MGYVILLFKRNTVGFLKSSTFTAEKRWFIASHEPWPKKKLAFAKCYYAPIAKEVNQWIDDRALFIFSYLVKEFGEKVLAEQLYEKEIWVTNLFDQNLNVVRRVESDTTSTWKEKTMLHPETAKLIEEVLGFFDDTYNFSTESRSRKGDLAKSDPEACIVALLRRIKERLPVTSATLYHVVKMSTFEDGVKEARKLLGSLAETSLGKAPRKKIRGGTPVNR